MHSRLVAAVLLVFSRIRALVAGEPAVNADVRFEGERWTVLHGGEKVGDLPVYPDFDLVLLREWAGSLLASSPLPAGKAGPPASLEVFPVESAQALLRVLDADWVKARHAKLLRPAVRASVALVFQMRDYLQVSDQVAANALALLAGDKRSGVETGYLWLRRVIVGRAFAPLGGHLPDQVLAGQQALERRGARKAPPDRRREKGAFNRPLAKLEAALDSLGEPRRPSLYDAGIRRAFYRAFAYSGLDPRPWEKRSAS